MGEYGTSGADLLDRNTGRPRVLAEQCTTCIFRPGNLMHLKRGRLKQITEGARRADSFITCHATLPGMSGAQPAVCRGFFDRYTTSFLRVMGRLGGWHQVPPAEVAISDAHPSPEATP